MTENIQCKWCKDNPDLLIDEEGWELSVFKDDEDCSWIEMSTEAGFASTEINFCPMCGRKLL